MDTESPSESSDLSSVGSLSPPPPGDYPSPASSQNSNTGISKKPSLFNKHLLEDEDLPRQKKRRIAQVKPRTTQKLDLHSLSEGSESDQEAQLGLLLKVLRKRRKIVVIAGAGISVSAGIPDFRSSSGLFSTLRSEHKLKASGKHLFDASVYQTDSSTSSFHDMVRSLSKLVSNAKPTAFHQMLATLANEGRLMRLYTQNVDGIDTSLPPLMTSVPLSMKGPWPRTIQLHGGLEKMVCSKCNVLSDFQASLFEGPSPPLCNACLETDKVRTDHAGKRSHGVGRLRPRIVLYNEHNPDEEAIGTVVGADLRTRPDAVIVVGTSMKIPGVRRIVREMCGVVRSRRDGLTVWVNHEPPPVGKEFEDCFDLIVKGACDDVASRADMRPWDDCSVDGDPYPDLARARRSKPGEEVSVVIESQTKNFDHPIITPIASPRPESSKPPANNFEVRLGNPTKEPNTRKRPAINGRKAKGTDPKTKTMKSAPRVVTPSPVSLKANIANQNKAKRKTKANTPFKASGIKPKITTSFNKITKPAAQQPESPPPKRSRSKRPPVGTHFESGTPGAPMTPLSPQAARNNGPLPSPSPTPFKNHHPNLKSNSVVAVSRRKSRQDIEHPKGAIPSGMTKLLHLENGRN